MDNSGKTGPNPCITPLDRGMVAASAEEAGHERGDGEQGHEAEAHE